MNIPSPRLQPQGFHRLIEAHGDQSPPTVEHAVEG
ncbi:hypothetical protein AB7M32_003686 [Pseudomonas sp. R151218B TE3479]